MADNDTNASPTPVSKRHWRRWLRWTIRIVVVLAVTLGLAYAIWNYRAASALRAEIDRIRAAGEPTTFAELAAGQRAVDRERDAAPFYAAALELLYPVEQDELDVAQALLEGPVTPEALAQAERVLERNRLALELLDRGSAMPQCAGDLGLRHGIGALLPRLNDTRALAQHNSIRTRMLAVQGKAVEAVDSAIASLRLTRMLDRQPILVAQLVKMGCAAMAVRDIQVILNNTRPDHAELARLGVELAAVEASSDLHRLMLAERVYALEMMRNLMARERQLESAQVTSHDEPSALAPNVPFPERWPVGNISAFSRTMALGLLQTHGRLIDAATRPYPQVVDAFNSVEAPAGYAGVLGQVLLPAMRAAVVNNGNMLAQVRSARAALMVERYRLAQGGLPDSLADLPGDAGASLLNDPFTGQGLVYRKTPDGYVIFSLGADKQKNPDEPLNRGRPGDWGIRVEHRLAPRKS